MNTAFEPRPWMSHMLRVFGAIHVLLGSVLFFAPASSLRWIVEGASGLVIPLWQGLGSLMIVGGVGCLIAAKSPLQHQLFLAIVAGALVSLSSASLPSVADDAAPTHLLWIAAVWGLIWLIPVGIILWRSIRSAHARGSAFLEPEADDPLRELLTNTGKSIDDLANVKPQMVVFLRHAGCTFCRQTLADVRAARHEIEAAGCGIVFVHLGHENDVESTAVFTKYAVADCPRISDPTSRLYRQFGLDLGDFSQLFGLRVWLNGITSGLLNRHGIGAIRGNSFQMPGVYLYHCGVILGGFRHERGSDRPNFAELARQVQAEPSELNSEVFST